MANFDAAETTKDVTEKLSSGNSISDDYNALTPDQQKAVYNEMTRHSENYDLGDLIIVGEDTDGDGDKDSLKDVYSPTTTADLYSKPGETDTSDEIWKARFAIARETQLRNHDYQRSADALKGFSEIRGDGSVSLRPIPLEAPDDHRARRIESITYIDRLMKPGNLEQAVALNKILEEEGFSINPSLKELSDPEFTKMLIENADERQAYKEFAGLPWKDQIAFVKANGPEMMDLSPSERMRRYNKFVADAERRH